MTENSKNTPAKPGATGMEACHPAVSAQLRSYYQSVQDEGIPDRLLALLEKLDMAERQAHGVQCVKDDAR